MIKNRLIEFSLVALLFGCTQPRVINHPQSALRVSIGHNGYAISKNNIYYMFRDNSVEGCTLVLGRDAELYDFNCNGVVDNFYDNQGNHLCEENPNERCNLATRIFQQKKEMLKVNEVHQLWLKYMSKDSLSGYLD